MELVHINLDHRDDARPLNGEVTVDEAIAQPNDGPQVRNACLDRVVQAIRFVQGLADRDQ